MVYIILIIQPPSVSSFWRLLKRGWTNIEINKNDEPKFNSLAFRAKALQDLTEYGKIITNPDNKNKLNESQIIRQITRKAEQTYPYRNETIEDLVDRVLIRLGLRWNQH